MVASCGWIMPEPLATPVIDALPDRRGRLANLGRESVVRIASAKFRKCSAEAPAFATSAPRWDVIFSTGRGTPMIPVDEGNISETSALRALAVSLQTALQLRKPCFPVEQFALPEFTTTARTRPRL